MILSLAGFVICCILLIVFSIIVTTVSLDRNMVNAMAALITISAIFALLTGGYVVIDLVVWWYEKKIKHKI